MTHVPKTGIKVSGVENQHGGKRHRRRIRNLCFF